ncbi:hypothetical protein [Methanocella sp. MCL-LM]|uniref:hypothetical protein n=1 Tax=Methanocella sp. MCL-LM TaxID=3412035 RepID=UPI003C791CFC
MDKIKLLAIMVAIIAALGMALLLTVQQEALMQQELNVSGPAPGYIGSTQIYLIDSNLSYERFEDTYLFYVLDHYYYIQGEPCAVIRGTIRNDGASDSWITIMPTVYDINGQSVGTVITKSTKPWFQTVFVESNGTESFEIPVKYYKRDIMRYELTLGGPTAYPPP